MASSDPAVSACWRLIRRGSSTRSAVRSRRVVASTSGCSSSSTCPAGSEMTRRAACRPASFDGRARAPPQIDSHVAAALVEPLSSAETALLTALAPLAARSPRDAKRFLNAYRLARCSGLPRPVMALMQAVAFAGDDARAAMQDQLAGGSRELGDVEGPAGARQRRQDRPRGQQRRRFPSKTRARRRKSPAATPSRCETGGDEGRRRPSRGNGWTGRCWRNWKPLQIVSAAGSRILPQDPLGSHRRAGQTRVAFAMPEASSEPAALAPISPDEPCGPDLDLAGDAEFLNFLAATEGALPARLLCFRARFDRFSRRAPGG